MLFIESWDLFLTLVLFTLTVVVATSELVSTLMLLDFSFLLLLSETNSWSKYWSSFSLKPSKFSQLCFFFNLRMHNFLWATNFFFSLMHLRQMLQQLFCRINLTKASDWFCLKSTVPLVSFLAFALFMAIWDRDESGMFTSTSVVRLWFSKRV